MEVAEEIVVVAEPAELTTMLPPETVSLLVGPVFPIPTLPLFLMVITASLKVGFEVSAVAFCKK